MFAAGRMELALCSSNLTYLHIEDVNTGMGREALNYLMSRWFGERSKCLGPFNSYTMAALDFAHKVEAGGGN